jgi:hypothetical protein
LSHLNATVTSRIVPVVEKTTVEPCTSTSSVKAEAIDYPTSEEKSAKKTKIKSIYDKTDDSQPKIPISFTPLTKTTPSKGVRPKKSHLANDDSIEIMPEESTPKSKPKKTSAKK